MLVYKQIPSSDDENNLIEVLKHCVDANGFTEAPKLHIFKISFLISTEILLAKYDVYQWHIVDFVDNDDMTVLTVWMM